MSIRVIGGIIAVVLIVLGFWFKGSPGPGPLFGLLGDPIAEMDEELQAQGLAAFAALKDEFPDDYRALLSKLAELDQNSGTPQEAAILSQSFMADLRKRHGPNLLRADPGALRAILVQSRALHQSILEQDGRQTCNAFAISGAPALGMRVQNYFAEIDAQGAALIVAMGDAAARDGAEAVDPATAEDRDAAIDKLVEATGVEAHRAALTNLAPEADICSALLAFVDAMLAMDNEAGARLRATYVRDLAIN